MSTPSNVLAPIVLFAYNRPLYVKQTLESLARNEQAKDSILYVYADGFKPDASEQDKQKIKEVRNIIRSKQWCKEVILIEREINLGLAKSIITGVTEVINRHGKVIVLEDDLELSPYFLQFMNEALDVYVNEPKVISVGACNFYVSDDKTPDTFFLPIPDCLGWATWQDRWALFESDSNKLYQRLHDVNLTEFFNLYGAYDFLNMLKMQAEGKISSWAIRWQAVAYLHQKLTIYPKYALSNHIGLGQDATNSKGVDYSMYIKFPTCTIPVKKHKPYLNKYVFRAVIDRHSQISGKKAYLPWNLLNFKELAQRGINKVKSLFNTEKTISNPPPPKPIISWSGNYASWEEAKELCTGYEADIILQKIRESVLKVKNGEAVYERDSVIFDKIQYNWPLLACLFKIGVEYGNKLSVLDFGGSLGSTYFGSRDFLKDLALEWSVVEQPHFVACGQQEIADGQLKFYYTIEDCLKERQPNVLLLSGVLQYLDKPYEWIEKLLQYQFPYVIIDRTAFIEGATDRLTIQEIHEPIYEASYPVWFFNEENFLSAWTSKHYLLSDFQSEDKFYEFMGKRITFKGFFLKYLNRF